MALNIIGIDLGMHKVAMFHLFADGDLYACDAQIYTTPESEPRDLQLRELAGMVQEWVFLHDPAFVWVEDVLVGNNHRYSLSLAETKGAVLSALGLNRMQNGTDIRTVNVKAWKKEVLGNGNATKDEVRDYIDVSHPLYAPLCDGDQDRYDAACIALYGLQVTQRADGLQLG